MRARLSGTYRLTKVQMFLEAGFPNTLLLKHGDFQSMLFDYKFEILRCILSDDPRADVFFREFVGLGTGEDDALVIQNTYEEFMSSKFGGSGLLLKACGTNSYDNISWTVSLLKGYKHVLEIEMSHIYPDNATLLTAVLKSVTMLTQGQSISIAILKKIY